MTTRLSDANADLMAPILDLLKGSKKDDPTKVGVLIDAAAAILATVPIMRLPSELRSTAEEMRKRLIQATRLHQDAIDARQQNATAAVKAFDPDAKKPPLRVIEGG